MNILEYRIQLFKKFLSENGITAEFLHELKPKHNSIEEYFKYLHNRQLHIRSAFFLAFYWKKNSKVPWQIHSKNWREFLKKRGTL